jgi:hypothetical protein
LDCVLPTFFNKRVSCLTGTNDPILVPYDSPMLDYDHDQTRGEHPRPERRPGDRRQDPGRQVAPPTRPSAGSGAAHREHLLDAGELDSWSSCRVSAATFRGVDPSPGVDVDHRGLSLRDQAIKIRKASWGLRQKVLGMIVED